MKKPKIFTIPNFISFLRIVVIPIFAWAYLTNRLVTALVLVVASGLSDTLDGTIARLTHQVSDVGKWLDPLADKLSQMALCVLMFYKFWTSGNGDLRRFAWVFLLFIGKEVVMLLVALVLFLLKTRPQAAEFWGKIATVVFYSITALLFFAAPEVGLLSQAIGWALPSPVVKALVIFSLCLAVAAFISYIPDTARKLFGKREAAEEPAEETPPEA